MNGNQWARLLAYATGLVNQELLLQNEYLAAENGILRAHLPGLRHCRTAREPHWRKSASVWGGQGCSRSLVSPGRIRFSAGIANWSLRSSTARNSAGRPADRASAQRSRIW